MATVPSSLLMQGDQMKKIIVLLTFIAVLFSCIGCSNNQASSSVSNVQKDATNTMDTFVSAFERIESSGANLLSCFEDYLKMNSSAKYATVKKAEEYTKIMESEYDDIIEHYQDYAQLENIVYQVRLLKNLIPQPIDNTEQALNNAAVLYQLYFQQISSSFSIIASNINDIEKGQNISHVVGYYDELNNMPMPDTMIKGIDFLSKVKEDGIIKYTYISDKDNTNAQLNYNLFLIAVGMDTGLSLKFDENAAYVYKESTMVSAIMAGNDAELGNFFMVSFQE